MWAKETEQYLYLVTEFQNIYIFANFHITDTYITVVGSEVWNRLFILVSVDGRGDIEKAWKQRAINNQNLLKIFTFKQESEGGSGSVWWALTWGLDVASSSPAADSNLEIVLVAFLFLDCC